MPKPRGVAAKLTRLRALRSEAVTPDLVAELRTALADPSNLVVAAAAEIVGARILSELAADLVTAFTQFMSEPAEQDKLCRAKTAIVEALNKIEHDDADVFLRGIRHVQIDAAWPESHDTAANLRASSAFALMRIGHRDLLILLADLLADPEKAARQGAAQALGASGAPAAIPLLRFKARAGDPEPDVAAECLSALMSLAPDESLPFVTEFLHHGEEAIREGAALALGESRRPEALPILTDFWLQARHGTLQDAVLLAISMLRLPAAIDFLVDIVGGDSQESARAALAALAIHQHNQAVKERVTAAVAKKCDPALVARFAQKFKDSARKAEG